MKRVIALILTVWLCGCTHDVKPVTKSFNNVLPGVVQTRKVGESLFEMGTVEVAQGFRARRDSYVPLMGHLLFPFIKRGDIWVCDLRLENDDFACSSSAELREAVETDKGLRLADDIPRFIFAPTGKFQGLYFTGGEMKRLDNLLAGVFEPVEVPMVSMTKKELIYKGKEADSIKLLYKEFSGDVTGSAIQEKLNYDMASLNIVQVKNLIIQVLDANEAAISYVIKN